MMWLICTCNQIKKGVLKKCCMKNDQTSGRRKRLVPCQKKCKTGREESGGVIGGECLDGSNIFQSFLDRNFCIRF